MAATAAARRFGPSPVWWFAAGASAGHATTAAAQNRGPDRTIMRQIGHRRLETLDGYIRPATVFIDNSVRFLGLDEDAER